MIMGSFFSIAFAIAWLAFLIFMVVKFLEIAKNSNTQKSYMEFLCNHLSPEEFAKFKKDLEKRD